MTEILTESFCERCGTRYTFESARPKLRLKGVKVMSRGLKNFVLSDGSSMDEAMAAARSETEREVTSYQLDAFHKTFNFCMQCRQYTCPNCWNEAEARCLTCAPRVGHEGLPAPFPALSAAVVAPIDDPTGGGAMFVNGMDATNGVHATEPVEVEPPDADFDVAARLDALTIVGGPIAETVPAAAVPAVGTPKVAAAGPSGAIETEPEVVAEAIVTAEPDEVAADHDAAKIGALAATAALIADPTADATPAAAGPEGKPRGLLSRFKPGQSLDAELEAYEREQAAAAAAAAIAADPIALEAAVEPDAFGEAAVEHVAVEAGAIVEHEAVIEFQPEPEVAAEPDLADAAETIEADVAGPGELASAPDIAVETGTEPEMAWAEPEVSPPAVVVADAVETEVIAEAEPEPIAAATETHPEAASVSDDVIAQPTWQGVAPAAATSESVDPGSPELPAAATDAEPQWPTRPAWLSDSPNVGLPFLGRSSAPQGGLDALWAESNREVASPPSANKQAGVQPCVNCGLSLSATARFCRRCGTPQGS